MASKGAPRTGATRRDARPRRHAAEFHHCSAGTSRAIHGRDRRHFPREVPTTPVSHSGRYRLHGRQSKDHRGIERRSRALRGCFQCVLRLHHPGRSSPRGKQRRQVFVDALNRLIQTTSQPKQPPPVPQPPPTPQPQPASPQQPAPQPSIPTPKAPA